MGWGAPTTIHTLLLLGLWLPPLPLPLLLVPDLVLLPMYLQ